MSRSRAAVPAGLLAAFKFSQETEEADQEHVVAAQQRLELRPHLRRLDDVVHDQVVPGVQQGGQRWKPSNS